MSLSVNGSNSNPFAYLQSLWQQQGSSASGTQSQSDPLSALLASLGEQTSSATSATGATTPSAVGASPTGSTSPQFGPQTLQALLALQANGSNAQPLASQFGNATTGDDPLSALQSQSSQGGHHHRHRMSDNGTNGQTGSGASGTSNSSGQSGTGTSNNILSQLLQMQAQLAPAAAAQNITTA
ncbi:MAG TPA: hypothetical protein VMF12_17285 [Xanthobacteraceae bacterium]|nr:hypothetical protein [Xanthobacteraceae bacterium]